MKLGNISQTIVPVPKYFLNKKTVDLFTQSKPNQTSPESKNEKKTTRNHSYYRTKDILTLNFDFNINHNPRLNERQTTLDNIKKYIPIYHKYNFPDDSEKKSYFPNIIDMNAPKLEKVTKLTNYQKFKEYKKKLIFEDIINPKLRDDIMNNTQNLLRKINMNYDLKEWNDFDSRTTFNKFYQTVYSPISNVIKHLPNDKDVFSSTLREKALKLTTINSRAKESIYRNIKQKESEKSFSDEKNNPKFCRTGTNMFNKFNKFLNLEYNNCDNPQYNKKDKKFIDDNKYITQAINRTKLYKDFPSSIREEFNQKVFYKKKKQLKMNELEGNNNFISKEKYGYKNVNSFGDELTSCQNQMWIRPLHKDAFK